MKMNQKSSPRRTRIEDIRREELIGAAYRIFRRGGLRGLTTAKICAEAGLSPGILGYYFATKDDVLFEMVRVANRRLMEDVVRNLQGSRTRWDRLMAIIAGNFPPESFERNIANAWVSFYAEAAHNVRFQRLQRVFYCRLRSNLSSAVRPLLTLHEFDLYATGFTSLLNGLWLQKGQFDSLSVETAIRVLTDYTESTLGPELAARLRSDPVFAA